MARAKNSRTTTTRLEAAPSPESVDTQTVGAALAPPPQEPPDERPPTQGTPEPETAQEGADAAPGPAREAPPEDIFDLAAHARKTGQGATGPTIKRKPTAIKPVTKLRPWFRVHPQGIYRNLDIFMDPNSEEIEKKPHYVVPALADEMYGVDGLRKFTGYLIVTVNGTTQLFLVPEADEEGRNHDANEDKHEACEQALTEWTRLVWRKEEKQYQIMSADWPGRKPKWPPELDEASVLRRAFKKAVVTDTDHPLVKLALGEG